MNKAEILSVFQDVVAKPLNSYLEKWISGGGKCVGYYCSLIPGEILTAAGMVPYRVRGGGSQGTSLADVYLSSHVCSFARHTANLALEGQFDFLNGIVGMNGCDHSRRAYDVWERKKKVPFHVFLSVPRTQEERLLGWYKEELERLIKGVEDHFSVRIGPQELQEAIKLHNTVRKNLIKLNDLRKAPNPSIGGSEALTITIAAHLMPPKEFNKLAEQLMETLDSNEEPRQYRARLIVTGGEIDEPEFIKIIEEQGGLVVCEDVCFGALSYEDLVSEEGDPLTKIAERYFYRMPCARMVNGFPTRYEHLRRMMRDFQADGLIAQRLKFCIINAGYLYNLRRRARIDEIPTLLLEREYLATGIGQVRTRVQAFIESIEPKYEGEVK
jgi:benzoyl-CoA reductase subunit C